MQTSHAMSSPEVPILYSVEAMLCGRTPPSAADVASEGMPRWGNREQKKKEKERKRKGKREKERKREKKKFSIHLSIHPASIPPL